MLSADTKKKLMPIMALALPVVLVKLTTAMMGASSPHAAQATMPIIQQTQRAIAQAQKKQWSAQQLEAAQYAQSLQHEPFGLAPLLTQQAAEIPPAPEVPVNEVHPQTDLLAPIPEFTLGAVMASGDVQRAVINGRPYLQGERIRGTSWKVVAIDSTERSATLSDSLSHRTLTIAVEVPR